MKLSDCTAALVMPNSCVLHVAGALVLYLAYDAFRDLR
jgi:hypothetical protein